jgi:hypothetical protein
MLHGVSEKHFHGLASESLLHVVKKYAEPYQLMSSMVLKLFVILGIAVEITGIRRQFDITGLLCKLTD